MATCYNDKCSNTFDTDDSHRFGVGISHYGPSGQSYMQVHETMHSCSRDCALQAAHARLDSHKSMQHGVFDASVLNPTGNEYPDFIVKSCAEYTPHARGKNSLPSTCAACGVSLSSDVYVPHVDDSTRGTCFQEVLQKRDTSPKSLEMYDLGACSNEHAILVAHAILDNVLMPDEAGKDIKVPNGDLVAPSPMTVRSRK